MEDVVDRLRRTGRLETDDDARVFEEALDDLPAALDPETIRQLFLAFDDETSIPEVMFDLVHRLEDSPLEDQLTAFLAVLPDMVDRTPWWAEQS